MTRKKTVKEPDLTDRRMLDQIDLKGLSQEEVPDQVLAYSTGP